MSWFVRELLVKLHEVFRQKGLRLSYSFIISLGKMTSLSCHAGKVAKLYANVIILKEVVFEVKSKQIIRLRRLTKAAKTTTILMRLKPERLAECKSFSIFP